MKKKEEKKNMSKEEKVKESKKVGISKEEFSKMSKIELGEGKGKIKIVKWKEVEKEFRGKVWRYNELVSYVKEKYNKKLYYSEIYRWIGSLRKEGNKVEIRKDDMNRRFVFYE